MSDQLFQGVYDSQDDIPETVTLDNVRDLYVERDGKYEFKPNAIPGLSPASSVSRLETAKARVAQELKEAKEAAAAGAEAWGDLKPDEVRAKLDRIEALEAAADGKLDDEKINELARRRADAEINGKLAPKERELAKIAKERDTLLARVEAFEVAEVQRKIGVAVRNAGKAAGFEDDAYDDAELLGQNHLEIRADDGAIVTRAGIEVRGKAIPEGLDPAAWVAEIQDSRRHWFKPSEGAGAKGSRGGAKGGPNPWKADSWSVSNQGKVAKERGIDVAKRMAEAAGSHIGATAPALLK